MAKTKTKRRKKGFTIPVAIVAGFIPLAVEVMNQVRTFGAPGLSVASRAIVPFNTNTGRWDASRLGFGLWPVLLGLVVHKGASMLGVNRAIAGAGIPFFRI